MRQHAIAYNSKFKEAGSKKSSQIFKALDVFCIDQDVITLDNCST